MANPDDKTKVSPAPQALPTEVTAPIERTVIVAPLQNEATLERVECTEKVANPFAAEPGWEAERVAPVPPSTFPDAPVSRTMDGASKWKASTAPTPAAQNSGAPRVSVRAPEPPRSPVAPAPTDAVGHDHELRRAQDAWKSALASTLALLKIWVRKAWHLVLNQSLPVWRKAMHITETAIKKVEAHADSLERRATLPPPDEQRRTMDVEAKSGDTADRKRAQKWDNFGKGKTTSYLKDDDKKP